MSATFTSAEDNTEGTVVQQKGRFKVTSADRSPKGATNSFVTPFSGSSTIPTTSSVTAASVLPSLQYILQQNNMQREHIVKLIKLLEQPPGHHSDAADAGAFEFPQGSPASARERELQGQVIQLQQSIGSVVEELQRLKMRNAQLERQLTVLLSTKEEDRIQKDNENQS